MRKVPWKEIKQKMSKVIIGILCTLSTFLFSREFFCISLQV